MCVKIQTFRNQKRVELRKSINFNLIQWITMTPSFHWNRMKIRIVCNKSITTNNSGIHFATTSHRKWPTRATPFSIVLVGIVDGYSLFFFLLLWCVNAATKDEGPLAGNGTGAVLRPIIDDWNLPFSGQPESQQDLSSSFTFHGSSLFFFVFKCHLSPSLSLDLPIAGNNKTITENPWANSNYFHWIYCPFTRIFYYLT